ncbi:MAG: hypothetical protein IJW13_06410 [Clostridia bacterium]|nr:hypothetical protein [Clostridia bacterium]
MKFLKSALVCALTAVMLTGSACMQETKTYNIFGGSFWLASKEVGTVGSVNETCVYSVQFVPSPSAVEGETTLQANLVGNMVTTLTNESLNGTDCYKFTTSLTISGNYTFGDTVQPVNDVQTSEVYFLGFNDKLTPISSKKYVRSTTPAKSGNSVLFVNFEYSVESSYDREKHVATVTTTPGNAQTGEDSTTNGYAIEKSTREYEKYNSSTFFDNESLIFIPRASTLESGFYKGLTTIDALAQKVLSMSVSVESSAPTKEFKIQNFVSNGREIKEKTFNTYIVTLSITDTFSGNPIKLYYSGDYENDRKRLVYMETQLPYSLGSFAYTLTEVQAA